VIGYGEDRPCVALAELSAFDESEDVVGQIEEAHAVRHGRLRAAHPLGYLAE
jgi:hypothetical protein